VKHLDIIIITGLSGSGKSTAIAAFEDAGFYCVDNMPVALLPKFLELPFESEPEVAGFAFVMDLREKGFLSKYSPIFDELKQKGYQFEIFFLEADEEILLQRYKATRRQHPLSQGKALLDGIRAEKSQLENLRQIAHKVIDTSHFNVHELKTNILELVQRSKKNLVMQIQVLSFGFKFGTPQEADLIVDVRFLINPFFISELKHLNGEDEAIKKFVLHDAQTSKFLEKYLDLLDYLIPLYEKEGKSYLTIAVGCTGGRHRSVTVARAIYEHIKENQTAVELVHRDIGQTP
jgi:UPF0042 nucleotide-binding protein